MNRGAWQTIVYGVKESDMTERALVGFTTGKINALPIAYCFNLMLKTKGAKSIWLKIKRRGFPASISG